MKLYGLFEYTYDWYEWETLICVSKNKQKLIKRYNEINKHNLELTEDDDTHILLNGVRHYMIKEVECL